MLHYNSNLAKNSSRPTDSLQGATVWYLFNNQSDSDTGER